MLKLSHPFILASASPRRVELLAQIGIVSDEIVSADVDETPWENEKPAEYAKRMADLKLHAVAPKFPSATVLAADTVVAVGRRILPKAEDEATARRCLNLLSGRRSQVHTAIAVQLPNGGQRTAMATTIVRFKRLSAQEISAYLASDEWRGKAGGYAIQGKAAAFIPWIQGSYSNVVGLPLAETANLLSSFR